jgi:prephenate dehydrogenase
VQWKKITIAGVGLLGGSLGLALRERRLAREVTGFVRRASSVQECERLGAVDHATLDLKQAVAGAGLVVLCTPVGQMRSLAEEMLPALEPGTVVTDVGSVKGVAVRDLETLLAKAGAHYVGSHPMAGAERMGVAASRADLFVDALCVVTPTPKSDLAAVRRVGGLWKSVGARLIELSPETHDELVARASHLPQAVAAVLAHLVLAPHQPRKVRDLCAGGFRDTTRIASGSPEMWRDIALANSKNLSCVLGEFIGELQAVRRALRSRDEAAITRFFTNAKRRRDAWCDARRRSKGKPV